MERGGPARGHPWSHRHHHKTVVVGMGSPEHMEQNDLGEEVAGIDAGRKWGRLTWFDPGCQRQGHSVTGGLILMVGSATNEAK